MQTAEPVRLVIWDLDETFWGGTLTEGGISFRPETRDIVTELARRGIVSSICSKNDFDQVRQVLTGHGVWDYFVFPSIDWTPKGRRVAALVEAIQLRPATVMFIDDNPSNLAEVRDAVPGIQARDHTFVSEILAHPLFKGKDDSALKRLQQYKLLEKRKADEAGAGVDVVQFLRDSEIRVELDFDIEGNLDRAVELINRTNQLNFTKARLSDDPETARRELRATLAAYHRQAALVRVKDRYGDHGYCGIYVHCTEERRLQHFAFSCRILGMGVERWLYNELGRPAIEITGEVLSNLFAETPAVDWINQGPATPGRAAAKPGPRVVARGGCDLAAIMHYFAATSHDAVCEYHLFRNGTAYRVEHGALLPYLIDGLTPAQAEAAAALGYQLNDFQSSMFERTDGAQVVLLSFATDAIFPLWRHRTSGLTVPFLLRNAEEGDARVLDPKHFPQDEHRAWALEKQQLLRDEYDYLGLIGEEAFKQNLSYLLRNLPSQTRVFVIEQNEKWIGAPRAIPLRTLAVNRWLREVAAQSPNVTCIATSRHVHDASDLGTEGHPHIHFSRAVYHRLYREIAQQLAADHAASAVLGSGRR
jgi:FkbH-like protein